MRSKFTTRSGETILEVVISVSVLMIVMVPASGLLINLIQNSALKRDNATASYRAEDGLEVLRGMRDSNLRNFSSKKSACWNTKPEYGNADGCENNKIASGTYRLTEDNTAALGWTLELATSGDLSEKLDSQNPQTDDFFRLYFDSDTNSYNYDTTKTITSFYRQITIEYLNFTDPPTGAAWTAGDDAMKVILIVRFRNGTKIQEIKLGEILTKPASS